MTPWLVAQRARQLIMTCHNVVLHTTNAPDDAAGPRACSKEEQQGTGNTHAHTSPCTLARVDRNEAEKEGGGGGQENSSKVIEAKGQREKGGGA